MNDEDITCATCAWWAQIDDSDLGQCRLYAPRPKDHNRDSTRWPVTGDDDWCGEWDNNDIDDEDDDSDDLVDEVFDDIVERLTSPRKRRWWRRSAA